MSVKVILTQMAVIAIFLVLGYLARKRDWIREASVKDLSWILVNIGGPCQALSTVLNAESAPDKKDALLILAILGGLYVVFIILGLVMGPMIRAKRSDWRFYNVMTVFGNVGFLGIPLAQALMGSTAAFYMAMCCMIYNLLFYSYGYLILRPEGGSAGIRPSIFINPGVIATILAFVAFFTGLDLPGVVDSSVLYAGNTVTFLAVFVIGCNLAAVSIRELFTDRTVIIFLVIKQLVFPIACILILRQILDNELILGVLAITLSVPVGNSSSLVAATNGCDLKTLTKATVLTTLLSIVTMTVCLLVAAA